MRRFCSFGIRNRIYALAFVDEFGPLYALYVLWFNDHGIDAAELSVVYIIWSAIPILLEVPSGALADRVDRRWLLATAYLLRAVGLVFWLLFPTYLSLIAGALLWSIHSTLASGATEAMTHDQLAAEGQAAAYGKVMARGSQFSHVGIAGGTVIGSVGLALGANIESMGWITVAVHAVSIWLVLGLPDVQALVVGLGVDEDNADDGDEPESLAAWWQTLKAGVAEARRSVPIRRLIIVGATIEGLFVFDEYVPLLARLRGAGDAAVPVFVLFVFVGLIAGDEVAARRDRTSSRTLGLVLIAGVLAIVVSLVAVQLWSLVLVAVGYGALELVYILADARSQEQISPEVRATVTSVRGLLGGLVSVAAFGAIAWLANGDDPTTGLLAIAAVLIAIGVAIIAWFPQSSTSTGE